MFNPIPDYYKILEISHCAKNNEIKASYKSLAKKYHPDKNNNIYSQTMVEINIAYEILGDEEKKHQYDKLLNQNGLLLCYNNNPSDFSIKTSAASFFSELTKININNLYQSPTERAYNNLKKTIEKGSIKDIKQTLKTTHSSIIKGNNKDESLLSIALLNRRESEIIEILLLAGAEFSSKDFERMENNIINALIQKIDSYIINSNKREYIAKALPIDILKNSFNMLFNKNTKDHINLLEIIVSENRDFFSKDDSFLLKMLIEKQLKAVEILLKNGSRLNIANLNKSIVESLEYFLSFSSSFGVNLERKKLVKDIFSYHELFDIYHKYCLDSSDDYINIFDILLSYEAEIALPLIEDKSIFKKLFLKSQFLSLDLLINKGIKFSYNDFFKNNQLDPDFNKAMISYIDKNKAFNNCKIKNIIPLEILAIDNRKDENFPKIIEFMKTPAKDQTSECFHGVNKNYISYSQINFELIKDVTLSAFITTAIGYGFWYLSKNINQLNRENISNYNEGSHNHLNYCSLITISLGVCLVGSLALESFSTYFENKGD